MLRFVLWEDRFPTPLVFRNARKSSGVPFVKASFGKMYQSFASELTRIRCFVCASFFILAYGSSCSAPLETLNRSRSSPADASTVTAPPEAASSSRFAIAFGMVRYSTSFIPITITGRSASSGVPPDTTETATSASSTQSQAIMEGLAKYANRQYSRSSSFVRV